MAVNSKQYLNGFEVYRDGRQRVQEYPMAASQVIARGEVVYLTSGFADTASSLTNAVVGVAAAAVTEATAANGGANIPVTPLNDNIQFRAPVKSSVLITTAARGTVVDIDSTGKGVDLTDTTISSGYGFHIDEIDASADAVAANTYGFAIGRFVSL
jgi:hypothetical protein